MSSLPQLNEVLKKSEISEIYWIDDDFRDELRPERAGYLLRICRDNKHEFTHTGLQENMLSEDEQFETWVANFTTRTADELQEFVHPLLEAYEKYKADPALDFTDNENPFQTTGLLADIVKKLPGCKSFSKYGWDKVRDEVTRTINKQSTLFLIDLDFTKENLTATAGAEVLRDVLKKTQESCPCIILTGSKMTQSDIVSQDSTLKTCQFSVLVKTDLVGNNETEFIKSFREALIPLTTYQIISSMQVVAEESLKTCVSNLTDLDVEAIDQAIFASSMLEGASEIDVLQRILMLNVKSSLEKQKRDEIIIQRLRRIRELRVATKKLETQPSNRFQIIREWRELEIFESGDTLNAIHAPLALGDVFELTYTGKEGEIKKKFILLAPPCDLVLRPPPPPGGGDPDHKARETLLAQIEELTPPVTPPKGHPWATYTLKQFQNGKDWRIRFYDVAACSTAILSLAVLNADGSVAIDASSALPNGLLPYWKKRFEKFKKDLKKHQTAADKENAPWPFDVLSTNKKVIHENRPIWNVGTASVSFKAKRIGRVKEPLASAALSAFSVFFSRVAYDHDFASDGQGDETTSLCDPGPTPVAVSETETPPTVSTQAI